MGPIVCDDDGPIPTLNNSKTLIMPLPSAAEKATLRWR
jgi:hypothetical protein